LCIYILDIYSDCIFEESFLFGIVQAVELSPTLAAMLEQAARVESARLSLVRPLVETIKIFATKDLNEDELEDIMERSRSVLIRTEYIEPFQEQFPLNHTLTLNSRVSPSRSVGSLSPTNDFTVSPSVVETPLNMADADICDVLFEEEILPEPPSEVTRPPRPPTFDSCDVVAVEDHPAEVVAALDEVHMVIECSEDIRLEFGKATETEVDFRECEDDIITPESSRKVERPQKPPENWAEERSSSPLVFDEYFLEPCALETATLKVGDIEGAVLEKASVVEDDIYFVVEEDFYLEATFDLQQLMKLTVQQLMHSEERCASPFTDDNYLLKPISGDPDLLTLAPLDHVIEQLAKAEVTEPDLYYYEEESLCVDVVLDLTQMMSMTQRDLITAEERPTSPVVDETDFVQPLSVEVEAFLVDAVDHLESPLNQAASITECDIYYFEEESFTVDVVCDLTQFLQRSSSPFAVEEHVSSETVKPEELPVTETSTRPLDIRSPDVHVAAKHRLPESFVLPQVQSVLS